MITFQTSTIAVTVTPTATPPNSQRYIDDMLKVMSHLLHIMHTKVSYDEVVYHSTLYDMMECILLLQQMTIDQANLH